MINCLIYNLNITSYFSNFISNLSLQNEIKEIEQYLQLCEDFKIIKKFKKKKHIKISVISPIFNRERYIKRFLNSIQFQNFNDIEIIFVDDCSFDNSAQIIEDYKKKDKRIYSIMNKIYPNINYSPYKHYYFCLLLLNFRYYNHYLIHHHIFFLFF